MFDLDTDAKLPYANPADIYGAITPSVAVRSVPVLRWLDDTTNMLQYGAPIADPKVQPYMRAADLTAAFH